MLSDWKFFPFSASPSVDLTTAALPSHLLEVNPLENPMLENTSTGGSNGGAGVVRVSRVRRQSSHPAGKHNILTMTEEELLKLTLRLPDNTTENATISKSLPPSLGSSAVVVETRTKFSNFTELNSSDSSSKVSNDGNAVFVANIEIKANTSTLQTNFNHLSNSTKGGIMNSSNIMVQPPNDINIITVNITKPARPKPSHSGASVKDEDQSKWKRPPVKVIVPAAPKTVEIDSVGKPNNTINVNVTTTKNSSNTSGLNVTLNNTSNDNVLNLNFNTTIKNTTESVVTTATVVNNASIGIPNVIFTPQPQMIVSPQTSIVPQEVEVPTVVPVVSEAPKSDVRSLSPTPVPVLLSSSTRTPILESAQQKSQFLNSDSSVVPQKEIGSVSESKGGSRRKGQLSLFTSDAQYDENASGSIDVQSNGYYHDEQVSVPVNDHFYPAEQMSVPISDGFYPGGQMSVPVSEPEVQNLKEEEQSPVLVQNNVNETLKQNDEAESISSGTNIIHSIVRLLKKPGTFSNVTDENNNKFIETIAQKFKRYGVTKIHLAFICIGVFVLINSLIFVIILCHNPREPRSKQEEGNLNHGPHSRYTFFIVMFSLFMFTAEALEGAIHHLLASSSGDNGLPILDQGIDGPTLFWGLVCMVRFLCILLSGCIHLKPGKLLGVACFFTALGTIFLCIGSFGKDDFLWAGIILASLGLAPTLPTSLLWMAQYMHVTHRMCALMIILTSIGNSLTHGGLTHIAANSHVYSYILVTLSLSSLLLLLVSWCIIYTSDDSASRRRGADGSIGPSTDPSTDGYHLARQHDDAFQHMDDDDGMEMSRHVLRRSSVGAHHDDYSSLPASDRNLHRQLRHMHDLDHEEAGQSLLID